MGNKSDKTEENGLSATEILDDTVADDPQSFSEVKVENTIDNEEYIQEGPSFQELYEESLKTIPSPSSHRSGFFFFFICFRKIKQIIKNPKFTEG